MADMAIVINTYIHVYNQHVLYIHGTGIQSPSCYSSDGSAVTSKTSSQTLMVSLGSSSSIGLKMTARE